MIGNSRGRQVIRLMVHLISRPVSRAVNLNAQQVINYAEDNEETRYGAHELCQHVSVNTERRRATVPAEREIIGLVKRRASPRPSRRTHGRREKV